MKLTRHFLELISFYKFDVFEFKWSAKKKVKIPNIFTKTYPSENFYLINNENFMDFL